MAYEWIKISDFSLTDHTTKIYGIRLRRNSSTSNDLCTFLTEKEGYDATGKAYDAGKTEDTGYFTYHRFNLSSMYYEYYIRTGTTGSNIINSMSSITYEGYTWKESLNTDAPLYFGGMINTQYFDNIKDYVMFYLKVPFEPSKSSFYFSSTGGTDSFELEAETGWTATTESDWVSLSQTSGTTGATISLTCSRNTSTNNRTATITFLNDDGDTFDITVNQNRKSIWVPLNKMRAY